MIAITSGKIETAKKVVIYGPEGIGKSTLASMFPGVVFIDCEGSTKELNVSRYPSPATWDNVLEEIDDAIENRTCRTLVIDTADWAEILCIKAICQRQRVGGIEDIGYGKGYVYVAEEFGKMLAKCNDLITRGINVVFTAHAMMRKFEQPDELGAYDRWEMKLSKKTAPLLKEWADMVLFCNYKTTVVTDSKTNSKKATGGSRIMYTTHHPCWDAKNRYGLPESCEMDFKNIEHLFKKQYETPVIKEEKDLDWDDAITKKKPKKEKAAPVPKDEFTLCMDTNGITMEQVKAFSEYKGNFPGLDPIDYPDNYKVALMKIENIEKIKKYIKDGK